MQPSNEGMETTQTARQMGHTRVRNLSKGANVSIFSNLLTSIGLINVSKALFFYCALTPHTLLLNTVGVCVSDLRFWLKCL